MKKNHKVKRCVSPQSAAEVGSSTTSVIPKSPCKKQRRLNPIYIPPPPPTATPINGIDPEYGWGENWATAAPKVETMQCFTLTGAALGITKNDTVSIASNPPYYSKTLMTEMRRNVYPIFDETIEIAFNTTFFPLVDIWFGIALRYEWQVTCSFNNEHVVAKFTLAHSLIDIFDLFGKPNSYKQDFISGKRNLRLTFTKEHGVSICESVEEMALLQCQTKFRPQIAFQQRRKNQTEDAPILLPEGEYLMPNFTWEDDDSIKVWRAADDDSLLSFLTPKIVLGENESIMWEKDKVVINFQRTILPDTTSIPLFEAEAVVFKGICAKIHYEAEPSKVEQTIDLEVEKNTEIAMQISIDSPTWFNKQVTVELNTLIDWIDTPMIIL